MSTIFIILRFGPYSGPSPDPKNRNFEKVQNNFWICTYKDVIKSELLKCNHPCLTDSLAKMSPIFIILGFRPYPGSSPEPKNLNFEKVQINSWRYRYKEATNPELFKFDYPNHPEILKLSYQNINNYVKLAKNIKFRN